MSQSQTSPWRKMNVTYSPRVEESEKDIIISQLKAQVFELEQNEKNFSALQLKVKALNNEVGMLSDEKLRLEYELKQRCEMSDKQISELRNANDSLQMELSEKIQVNKKLFADNNSLFRLKESLNQEINELKLQINNLIDENAAFRGRNDQLERTLNAEKSNCGVARSQCDQLQMKLDNANRTIGDLNDALRNTQEQNQQGNLRNEESRREIANLNAQLKRKDDNLAFSAKQIDDLNNTCQHLKAQLCDTERKLNQQNGENLQLNNSLNAERNLRNSLERSNEQMEVLIAEKDKENRKLFADNTELRAQFDRSGIDNKILGNEVEKLKSHILVLTEQNQTVRFSINIFS